MGWRATAVVRVVGHLAPDLRGQHVLEPRAGCEDLAPRGLGGAAPVDVGGVEEVDAGLEGGVGAGAGLVELHAARVGEPGAEGDLRDLQVRGAELAISHRGGPYGLSPARSERLRALGRL